MSLTEVHWMASTRFVILHHKKPQNEHWDVMLEQGDVLLTWQLVHDPTVHASDTIAARRIQDHRKKYLNYEGPISGGRGEVSRVEVGAVIFLEESAEKILVLLNGLQLHGQFLLRHVCDDRWIWSAVVKTCDPI